MTTTQIDTAQFFTQLVATARATRPYAHDARQAAQDALDEAHSTLSQPAFFTAFDALGGQEAIIEKVVRLLIEDESMTMPL